MDPDEIKELREDIRSIDGKHFERIIRSNGTTEIRPIISPSSYLYSSSPILSGTTTGYWRTNDYLRDYFENEEAENVEIIRKQSGKADEHIVACSNEKDLSIENVLRTLSAIKGKLMVDVAPIRIKNIECSITPLVRKNIVDASKRLKMYGKKRPIIARFDEYANRLPDEIDLGTAHGITLKIIDPEDYGKYYIELKATEFGSVISDDTLWGDIPF